MKNRPVKLLVVEKNDSLFALLHDVLSRDKGRPTTVRRASDARQALRALQKEEYDACMLNCCRAAMKLLDSAIARNCAPPITILTNPQSAIGQAHKIERPSPSMKGMVQSTFSHIAGLRELQRSEVLFWTKFVQEKVALVLLDGAGRFVVANSAYLKMFGYSRRESKKLTLANLVHPDDAQENERLFQQLITGSSIQYQIENRCIRKDGALLRTRQTALGLCRPGTSSRGFALLAFDEMRSPDKSTEREKELERRISMIPQLFEAHESERRLIAQELHDSLGAFLAAIKYSLEKNLEHLQKQKTRPEVCLGEIIPLVQNAIEEIRRISTNLWPAILDDLGIIAGINSICSDFEKTYSSITLHKCVNVLEDEIPPHRKVVIYRILQEAFNNVAKHSGATSVKMSLLKTSRNMQLALEDNGKGFNYAQVMKSSTGGMGLPSMKNRAEISGGTFTIEARAGAGTLVRVVWPHR